MISDALDAWREHLRAKAAVMANRRPSTGDDLLGMIIDFDHYLRSCPALLKVEVLPTGRVDSLIEARCAMTRGDGRDTAAEIERVWLEDRRYSGPEAHLLLYSEDSITLDCISAPPGWDYYVTARISVDAGAAADGRGST